MALIIEDGTGIANADSFVSIADAQVIATNYGLTLPELEADIEILLRKAYEALNTNELKLQGSRTYDIQTGIFPRKHVRAFRDELADDSIPNNVKRAQVYMADAINSGMTTNSTNDGTKLDSFSVDGVYSESYQSSSTTLINPVVQGVTNSLAPYMKSSISGGGLTRNEEGYSNGWF